jgi:hypothetical protein
VGNILREHPAKKRADERTRIAASEAPFDLCYSGGMCAKLLGFDLVRLSRAASGELLFAWRDGGPREREEEPKNS